MTKNLEVPLLIALGAVVGIGALFVLIDLLPLIAVGGIGFLVWKLMSLFGLQEESECKVGQETK